MQASFAEIGIWEVPHPLDGSAHSFKYRLAFVVDGVCALRYDNECGKGDHRHTLDGEARALVIPAIAGIQWNLELIFYWTPCRNTE